MKAAIYSRKSKFTGKGESIENQVQMCKDYASMHLSHKKIDEFLIYEDEGFSGGTTNRLEYSAYYKKYPTVSSKVFTNIKYTILHKPLLTTLYIL